MRSQLENVSVTADIREGDLLETSGLGGRFPSGYPVGYVSAVVVDPTAAFATVTVRPLAKLDRSRHVLVVLSSQGLEGHGPADLPSEDGRADAVAGHHDDGGGDTSPAATNSQGANGEGSP